MNKITNNNININIKFLKENLNKNISALLKDGSISSAIYNTQLILESAGM